MPNDCVALQIVTAGKLVGPPPASKMYKPRDGRRVWRRMRAFARVYEENNGNVTETCRIARVQRHTYYRWMNPQSLNPLHHRFQSLIARTKPIERRVDTAEKVVDAHLADNNLVAAIFTLRGQGKHRGHNERELVGSGQSPVAIDASYQDQTRQLVATIRARAEGKGVSFQEELRRYLDIFGSTLAPEIGEKLNAELL